MSKREARKVTIIEELLAGRFTNNQAAELLSLSVRQVQRMKAESYPNESVRNTPIVSSDLQRL
jgi:hypothetical protein